jgi:hypothetical protein
MTSACLRKVGLDEGCRLVLGVGKEAEVLLEGNVHGLRPTSKPHPNAWSRRLQIAKEKRPTNNKAPEPSLYPCQRTNESFPDCFPSLRNHTSPRRRYLDELSYTDPLAIPINKNAL